MAEIRERLVTVGHLLGVALSVDDGTEWKLTQSGVQVGLGFYSERGHGEDEAAALALTDLWSSVRSARIAPVRMRRRIELAETRPELEPLLRAIDRCQAAAEVLSAMPALRSALVAATLRQLPVDLRIVPRAMQWAAMLSAELLAPEAELTVDSAVREENAALSADLFRRVCSPDPHRSGLERFERAVALLLPPFERLLELDLRDRSAWGAESGPSEVLGEDNAPASGSGTEAQESAERRDDSAVDEEAGRDAGADDADDADDAADNRAPASESQQDFHAAANATGLIERFIPDPLPVSEAMLSLLNEQLADDARAELSQESREQLAEGGAVGAVQLGRYRERVALHDDAIERMRDVWRLIFAERASMKRRLSRTPRPEGELLDTNSLAQTVAEVLAGSARPSAFTGRVMRPQRSEAPGSTDFVLVIDRSGSMQGVVSQTAADAALVMVEALSGVARDIEHEEAKLGIDLELSIRVALIVFDADAHVVKPLSTPIDDTFRRRLYAETLNAGGSTNDGAALHAAAEQLGVVRGLSAAGGGIERRRVIILVSDGGSNDPDRAANELRRLRAVGAEVFGIGIGSDEIARRYAPTSLRIDDPKQLASALQGVVERAVR